MNAPTKLPVLARILSAMITGHDAEVVRGDIEEMYRLRIAATGPTRRARFACIADVAVSVATRRMGCWQ